MIFAFGDPHLPIDSMVRRFKYPREYYSKMLNHLSKFEVELLLIAGDLTWESKLHKASIQLDLLRALPGTKKVIIEGNHDAWFDNLADDYEESQIRAQEMFNSEEFYYIGGRGHIFELDSGLKVGMCGARGFLLDLHRKAPKESYIYYEEQERALERSISDLESKLKGTSTDLNICMMHYPPTYKFFTDRRQGEERLFNAILNSEIIDAVVFAHIHKDPNVRSYYYTNKTHLFFTPIERTDFLPMRIPENVLRRKKI